MERPPALEANLVKEFVIAGHGNLDAVKQLLSKEPALINATWDWGGGDWETALGGAAHTGQREIALYLLANGAHIDIFTAAMLGKLTIVQAILSDNPAARHYPGPHGIPLAIHAKQGGQAAIAVTKYLESLE